MVLEYSDSLFFAGRGGGMSSSLAVESVVTKEYSDQQKKKK